MEVDMSQNQNNDQSFQRLAMGVIFICIGILFLLDSLVPWLRLDYTWPFFLLLPAAVLILVWIRRGKSAAPLVFPITLLLFFCGYFLWLNHVGWWHADTTWPNFLVGPGLAFLALYFVRRRSGLLIPAVILIGLAAIFYVEFARNTWFMGVVLMVAGIPFLLQFRESRMQQNQEKTMPAPGDKEEG